jgi:hypothetical protein
MEILGARSKWFIVMGLAFCLVAWWASAALADEAKEPEKPQWNISTDILSQYVWRGIALSRRSAVIQPSFTGSYKGFSLNVWNNFDLGEQNPYGVKTSRGATWNETDITPSYSYEILPNFTLTAGLYYYILDGNNSQFCSFEVWGGGDYKLPWFNFGVLVYREVAHYPGTYLTWYIHRAIDIPYLVKGMNLDLYASWAAEFSNDKAAYPTPDNSYFQGFDNGYLAVALNIPINKYVTIAPKIQYWYALGGQSTAVLSGLSWDGNHNHLLGGLNLTVNF